MSTYRAHRRQILAGFFVAAASLICGASQASDLLQCAIQHPGGHTETASVRMSGANVVGIFWNYKRSDGSRCAMDVTGAKWIGDDHLRLASGCELLFWQQGSRITVAPITESCARSCTSRNSLEGLHPIAFDLRTKSCADR